MKIDRAGHHFVGISVGRAQLDGLPREGMLRVRWVPNWFEWLVEGWRAMGPWDFVTKDGGRTWARHDDGQPVDWFTTNDFLRAQWQARVVVPHYQRTVRPTWDAYVQVIDAQRPGQLALAEQQDAEAARGSPPGSRSSDHPCAPPTAGPGSATSR